MKSLFGLYFSASLFFFAFPQYLRKSSVPKGSAFGKVLTGEKVLNICHRGNPRRLAENTLASFESCAEIGDMLEMDVCSTKDNVLVVHHDKDLLRTCGIPKQISQLNYNQLPSIQRNIAIHFDSPGKTIRTNCQKIPTLNQVFQRFPQTPMNIELKTPSPTSTDQLLSMIKAYNRETITVIGIRGSQSKDLQKKAKDTEIALFMSDRRVTHILLLYFSGLLPFIRVSQKILQIPLYTSNFHSWKKQEWKSPIKSFFFFNSLKLLNFIMIPLIWHLNKRGIMTFYWVCNNQQQFQRALSCGASGIITDEPQLLGEFLVKCGKN